MGKKRKAEYSGLDEVEQTLYHTFSTAANSISQLYTEGLKHQKRAYNAGAKATTEKILNFVLGEYSSSHTVPTHVLVEVLRRELEDVAGEEESLASAGGGAGAGPGMMLPVFGATKVGRAAGPFSTPEKRPLQQQWTQPSSQQEVQQQPGVGPHSMNEVAMQHAGMGSFGGSMATD